MARNFDYENYERDYGFTSDYANQPFSYSGPEAGYDSEEDEMTGYEAGIYPYGDYDFPGFQNFRNSPAFYPSAAPDVYGPYTGVGPRGYKRSGSQIQDDVSQRLWLDAQLDASDIEVQVNDAVVTLTGTVQSRQMKRWAEDIAWAVPGVDDVQNQLRVQQGQAAQPGTSGQPGMQGQQNQQRQSKSQGQQGQSSQSQRLSEIAPGMQVIGSDGSKVGQVDELHDYDFMVSRGTGHDVHIPYSEIKNVSNDQVMLNVPGKQVESMHWGTTPHQTAQAR